MGIIVKDATKPAEGDNVVMYDERRRNAVILYFLVCAMSTVATFAELTQRFSQVAIADDTIVILCGRNEQQEMYFWLADKQGKRQLSEPFTEYALRERGARTFPLSTCAQGIVSPREVEQFLTQENFFRYISIEVQKSE